MRVRLGDLPGMVSQAEIVAAFRYRDFRYYWGSAFFAGASRWIEIVIMGWLVIEMTNSPFLLGLAAAIRWIGNGLGPVFGTIADRYDRRKLLIAVAAISVLYSFVLGFLVITELVQYWHILAIALISGTAHAFDTPIRYAFIGDLVENRHLTNAIALNTVAIDITTMLGPAMAGPLISIIGIGRASWVMAFIYAANVVVLYMIRVTAKIGKITEQSLYSNLVEGVRYIRGNPAILGLLIIAAAYNLFEAPIRYVLLPVFADSILVVGASGYGLLLAVIGAGALVGAIIVASLGKFRHKAWLSIIGCIAMGIATFFFCISRSYPLSLALIGAYGLMNAIALTTISVLLLDLTPREMRGRVMGVRSFAVLPLALGNLISGMLASEFGAPAAGIINATLLILLTLVIAILVPSLRRAG